MIAKRKTKAELEAKKVDDDREYLEMIAEQERKYAALKRRYESKEAIARINGESKRNGYRLSSKQIEAWVASVVECEDLIPADEGYYVYASEVCAKVYESCLKMKRFKPRAIVCGVRCKLEGRVSEVEINKIFEIMYDKSIIVPNEDGFFEINKRLFDYKQYGKSNPFRRSNKTKGMLDVQSALEFVVKTKKGLGDIKRIKRKRKK